MDFLVVFIPLAAFAGFLFYLNRSKKRKNSPAVVRGSSPKSKNHRR